LALAGPYAVAILSLKQTCWVNLTAPTEVFMSVQTSTQDTQTQSALQSRDRDEDAALVELFERIASALSSGDAESIAAAWEAPALVVGDGGIHAVKSSAEVASFFAGARDQYTSRGISATRAEIARVSWVGARTAIAEVRWPLLDEKNRELGEERTTYTLRTGDDGELKIRVAVAHTPVTH
jgi:hypothetical protein